MSSPESDEDFIQYGTPLEELEEDEIPKKKPCLLEDQVVKDKQGRRRFHGAFTGGFSAGFFNTVGSLEGWTPSSFKSSKSEKKHFQSQKPEDFMDEEDFSEFGIAPVVLKAKTDYSEERKRKVNSLSDKSVFNTSVIVDLLKPVRETIGMKLLRKMGWKPGQGVGPRVSRREKIKTSKMKQKTYGCQGPPGFSEEPNSSDSESESEWSEIMFAPTDFEPSFHKPKDNYFGIGYEGLDKRPVLSSSREKDTGFREKNEQLRIGGYAFGVGAFEEEDEDIYSRDDMSQYDFSLGGDGAAKKSSSKTCQNSEGVLNGFVPEIKKIVSKKDFPLPILPKNFKPRHRISKFDQPPLVLVEEKKRENQKIGAKDRREVLGETNMEKPKQDSVSTKELISNVKISTSKFKPFSSNPDKQERYEQYLKLIQIGKKDLLSSLQPTTLTEWDKQREMVEFDQAAKLFKPLTGEMEERFLTASQPDDISDPLAVVEKFQDENDDRRKAAKMNMFGPLTRRTEEWMPCSLLCKRFNVPEPNKNSNIPKPVKKTTKFSFFDCIDALQTQKEKTEEKITVPDTSELSPAESSKTPPKPAEETQTENSNSSQNKIDIFKAIFLDDEDEDDEDKNEHAEKNAEEGKPEVSEVTELSYEEKVINLKKNTSPPRGIFENIDLELLAASGKTKTKDSNKCESPKKMVDAVGSFPSTDAVPLDLVYGPKIPDRVPIKSSREFETKKAIDDRCWVEGKVHSKKHKKKEKKKKKSSHKSKHKHKKSKK